MKQATDKHERCKAPAISATKPPQFEDGTTFDFVEVIDCMATSGENANLIVRKITISGRYFGPRTEALSLRIEQFD